MGEEKRMHFYVQREPVACEDNFVLVETVMIASIILVQ